MRIVVNHLTRMDQGYICVAGVDVETGAHIRPVVDHRMSEQLLRRYGGPFDLGALVDLGQVRATGTPPEMEDHSFTPRQARYVKDVSPAVFWRLLERLAQPSLIGIFGEELARHARTYGLPTKTGSVSLGCLRPESVSFDRNEAGKLRLVVSDSAGSVSLSLTDLRFYQRDHQTVRWELVRQAGMRLAQGVPAIISVGVGRAFKQLGDSVFRHWLQANNLHLADDPLWQERSLP